MASHPHVRRLKAAGLPPPPSKTIRALIDTGASSCALDFGIISALGLIPTGKTHVHTPSTGAAYEERELYDASLFLYPPGDTQAVAYFTVPVIGAHLASEGFLALIGWDVLLKCVLLCDGPRRTFRLDF